MIEARLRTPSFQGLHALVTAGLLAAGALMPRAGADIGPVDLPEHWGTGTRGVLVEPPPYPAGRARLVARGMTGTVAPDFVVAGPPYSREPVTATLLARRSRAADLGAPQFLPMVTHLPQGLILPPGAMVAGPSADLYAIHLAGPAAHARVGTQVIRFDPFARTTSNDLDQVEIARRIWLNEHGYVQRARILQRGVPSTRVIMMLGDAGSAGADVVEAAKDDERSLPTPRAVIKVRQRPVTTPLQASVAPAPTPGV